MGAFVFVSFTVDVTVLDFIFLLLVNYLHFVFLRYYNHFNVAVVYNPLFKSLKHLINPAIVHRTFLH